MFIINKFRHFTVVYLISFVLLNGALGNFTFYESDMAGHNFTEPEDIPWYNDGDMAGHNFTEPEDIPWYNDGDMAGHNFTEPEDIPWYNDGDMAGHNFTEPEDIPWYNDGGPCYSLKTALDIFTKDLYQTDQGVRILLDNFYANVAQLKRSPPLTASRKPFIVIEGMQRRLRYIVTRKVARYLKGMEVYNPPPGYLELRSWFNHSSSLRRAYFALCVYIAANNVKMTLPYRAAVMSGYWLDQATFALGKKYRPSLPPDDSPDWNWPADLLKPDLIFYLTNKEEIDPTMTRYYPTRKPDPLKETIGEIFKRWHDPKLIFIRNSTRYREIVAEMIPYINNLLYNWRLQNPS